MKTGTRVRFEQPYPYLREDHGVIVDVRPPLAPGKVAVQNTRGVVYVVDAAAIVRVLGES